MSLDAARSEAARVAACVDLRDIRVWGLKADLATVPDERETRLSYSFNADLQVQYNREDSILIVLGTYALGLKSVSSSQDAEVGAPDEIGGTEVATINFRLNALFEVEREPEDEPFDESELTAFGQTTGQFALYPYARELIADVTGRMGLPRLHTGVMRLSLTATNVLRSRQASGEPCASGRGETGRVMSFPCTGR